MNILVTGGAGYIGSVVVEELVKDGNSVVVLDNLSKGHREMVAPEAAFVEADIRDHDTVVATLREHEIEAVIHMAASSLVGESVEFPEKYYDNNVVAGGILLDAMEEAGVEKFVFSSTAAVYGEPENIPILESDTLKPTNPYGETKLEFERELARRSEAGKIKFASLRYFNAAGASKNCGELHHPETHLIPIVLQAAIGIRPNVGVFGDDYHTRDGTCVRDYIHVIDLARAHILALDVLGDEGKIYNLGCGGSGYTVREVVDAAREVTGLEIIEKMEPRRAGDPAVLIASSEKIRQELGWEPEFQDLKVIIESAWSFQRSSMRDHAAA
jgi:UDP-glucose 4-epimerase